MAASDDPVNFDIIEGQKENVQSLPGGRSARELARIFSPRDTNDILATPSPNDTRSVNDGIRQEFEAELKAIDDSDDPLDIYDRYVKWALNAYPTGQSTPESGLLPLLERAVRAFLSSSHYKNDPRYLRLWLQYIRLFSDSPRETFAFIARHHIGEQLALFYEEFAGWLESVGRWAQAEEVYQLGVDREARPAERLIRKYSEFQHRREQQPEDNGPTSPALPKVRPALATKTDPFASAPSPAPDQQQSQEPSPAGGTRKTKSGKPKMAIFSDDSAPTGQPALGGTTKGWESIGSMQDRKKENTVEARPWTGETLKAGKKSGPSQKMPIFRDESNSKLQEKEPMQPKHVPEHRVSEAVNPRTGRRERVFVDLEAVYPDYKNPCHEVSFEELRAMKRGWLDKNWCVPKQPLKQISGNVTGEPLAEKQAELPEQFSQKMALGESQSSQSSQPLAERESRGDKPRKSRVREVKGETQTIKMNFDSPGGGSGSKVKRKSTAQEPTMTMHTRAATDEIYGMFNQPLKAETEEDEDASDFDDDDCASVAESTVTGRFSAASSDFGDDDTFHRNVDGDEGFDDNTQAQSVVDGDWTAFTDTKPDSEPSVNSQAFSSTGSDAGEYTDGDEMDGQPGRSRFVPQMPEDYNPPFGTYRDPAIMAQNRLPFMTPIVEQTERSFPSMRTARSNLTNAKTPSKPMPGIAGTPSKSPMGDLLLSSPGLGTPDGDKFSHLPDDVTLSPSAMKARSSPRMPLLSPPRKQKPVVEDFQCNPTDKGIRRLILNTLNPPLASYRGFKDHPEGESHYAPGIQKYMRALSKRPKSGDEGTFQTPTLEFDGAERSYVIRRELGAGAYAPVYLAESVDGLPTSDSENDSRGSNPMDGKQGGKISKDRYGFEAVKMEMGPPNPWEFYMIRTAYERLQKSRDFSRAADSIIRVHELHVFAKESFLIEDYRGQGTLLDLINIIRNEPGLVHSNGEGGLDECLAMFFTIELFRTIEALHANGVLHGDIKPDNCLVRFDDATTRSSAPGTQSLLDLENDDASADPYEVHYSPGGHFGWRDKGLSLIDFGRSIDMRAFQPSVQFIADWEASSHECPEIREARPWTHQIDLYGVAGTVHVMLFGKYIESVPVRRSEGAVDTPGDSMSTMRKYRIRETLKRYWEREIWSDVFDLLLNPGAERWASMEKDAGGQQPSGSPVFPVLNSMRFVRENMENWLLNNAEKKGLALQIRKLEVLFADKRKKFERF